MARSYFGGTIADWLFRPYSFGSETTLAELASGSTVLTFHSAQTGGTQYTDLLVGGVAATTVTASGHQVPQFQGPDGVTAMWVDKEDDDSPRELMEARDLSAIAGAVEDAEDARDAAIAATTSKLDKTSVPVMADDPAYGLTGNTDNTVSMQAAIDAAAAWGRGVHFPMRAGGVPYMVGGAGIILNLPSGMTVTADRGVTFKVKNSNGAYHAILGGTVAATNLTGLTVRGITFDQNASNNAVGDVADFFVNTTQQFVILVGAGNRIRVQDCRFINLDAANTLYIGSSSMTDVRVQDCEFETVGDSPDYHDHSTLYLSADGITVTGNQFRGTLGGNGSITAIETHGPNQVVTGNRVTGYMIGANITGVTDLGNAGIVVANNTIEKARHGIQLWSYSGTLDGLRDCHIVDNTIRLDRDSWQFDAFSFPQGIAVAGSSTDHIDGLTIARNSIRFLAFSATALTGEYQGSGIEVAFNDSTRELRNFRIDHNLIIGSLGAGIRLSAKAIRGRVSFNTIVDPASSVEAAYTSFWRTGMAFLNDLLDVEVHNNRTYDTRGTHTLVQGFSTSITGTTVRSRQWDNDIICTDGTVLPESTQTALKKFTTRPAAPAAQVFSAGLYYGPQGARGTGTATDGQLQLSPFFVSVSTTFIRIGCEVTTAGAASTVVRLGIYADNGEGTPTARVLDAGTVTGDATGTKEITISQVLPAGLYWLGLVAQGGSPVVRSLSTDNIIGGAGVATLAVATGAAPRVGFYESAVAGALPATFTISGQTAAPGLVVLKV